MNVCLMFPGQGTQKPGMLRELGNNVELVEPIFKMAKEATGRDIKELCLSASAEELQRTENTQLAVTAMNLCYLYLITNEGIKPDVVLGHSLGQFSAFAASGVLSIEQTFAIVQKRAELMGKINRAGMLCSVLGLPYDVVANVCKEVDPAAQSLVIALHNTENQIVIGGDVEVVTRAEELCKTKGALRTVPIRVSHAFHTPLMQEMETEYKEFIDNINFSVPNCKLMLNCKGDYATSIQDIKDEIVSQCCHTVRWCDGVNKVIQSYDNIIFAECGVGKVLTGMMRSIDNKQNMLMLSNAMQYNKFINLVKE